MKRFVCLLIAAAGFALAQEGSAQRTIEVRFADTNSLVNLLRTANGTQNVQINADPNFHLVFLRGPEKQVADLEALVKKYDAAPVNIELTVYMVSGSSDGKAATDDVPAELGPTVKQLHGLFPYKSYRVLQSFVLRAREGRDGRDAGTLKAPDYARISPLKNAAERMEVNAAYDFNFQKITLSGGTPRSVHINGMALSVMTPTGKTNKDGNQENMYSQIRSDLDAVEGQKIVVGKSNLHGSEDALILVITAKVIQ